MKEEQQNYHLVFKEKRRIEVGHGMKALLFHLLMGKWRLFSIARDNQGFAWDAGWWVSVPRVCREQWAQ